VADEERIITDECRCHDELVDSLFTIERYYATWYDI
jgi:hypothetical protein